MSDYIARNCWCKNSDLKAFSDDYAICQSCSTLISQKGLSDESLQVNNDDESFYGKNYWLSHQTSDLSQPTIIQRCRTDLHERCAYWLRFLLKNKLPPARILEIGCAHGGFVAMMNQVGYTATGLELSPWIVDLAKKTFEIPVFTGPIESQNIEPESLDVVVLMDVLEHLSDPKSTIQACLKLLKKEGILLIQTPSYPEGITYDDLKKLNHAFLGMLQPTEHLYLYTQSSVQSFFQEVGISYFAFESAIFSQYDMFFVASRSELNQNKEEEIEKYLNTSVTNRFIRAILDARMHIEILEEDNHAHSQQIAQLTQWLKEAEYDRTERLKQIEQLTQWLKESEHDRAERLKIIESFSNKIGKKYGKNRC